MNIALIVDKPRWAYFNIAIQVKKSLEFKYKVNVDIIAIDSPKSWKLVHDRLVKDYNLIHYFWRGATRNLERVKNENITTSVYDHLDFEIQPTWNWANESLTGYWFSSNKLKHEYLSKGIGIASPVLTDGVDLRLFKPAKTTNFNSLSQTFKIGWVGNENWGPNDHKGLNSIVRPAISLLKKQGYSIELKLAGPPKNLIAHHNMPFFYHNIDLLVTSSISEGTPNPILESSSCGVPWLSTDVGIVSEFESSKTFKLIYQRSVEGLAIKIREFLELSNLERGLIKDSLLDEISLWNWSSKAGAISEYLMDIS